MNKVSSLFFLILQLAVYPALAKPKNLNTAITFGRYSPHIIQISASQLVQYNL